MILTQPSLLTVIKKKKLLRYPGINIYLKHMVMTKAYHTGKTGYQSVHHHKVSLQCYTICTNLNIFTYIEASIMFKMFQTKIYVYWTSISFILYYSAKSNKDIQDSKIHGNQLFNSPDCSKPTFYLLSVSRRSSAPVFVPMGEIVSCC